MTDMPFERSDNQPALFGPEDVPGYTPPLDPRKFSEAAAAAARPWQELEAGGNDSTAKMWKDLGGGKNTSGAVNPPAAPRLRPRRRSLPADRINTAGEQAKFGGTYDPEATPEERERRRQAARATLLAYRQGGNQKPVNATPPRVSGQEYGGDDEADEAWLRGES